MSKRILSVNSTRNGKFECTVLEESRGEHLSGSLCKLDIQTGHVNQTVLCRIGMIDTVSPVHDNPDFAPIIMRRGRIEYISGDADIETAKLEPIACVDDQGKLTSRKANPPSGTLVHTLGESDLGKFQREQAHYFCTGYVPGYPSVIVSIVNRHYGAYLDGGWDEAKFRIYVGQSGSGKTVVLMQHLAARVVAHPSMGALVIDTKGDIVVEGKHKSNNYNFSFHDLLRDGARDYELVTTEHIRLTSINMLADLIAGHWHDELRRDTEQIRYLVKDVVEFLTGETVEISKLSLEAIANGLADKVDAGHGWTSTKGSERQMLVERIRLLPQKQTERRFWQNIVVPYFEGKYTTKELAKRVLLDGQIILLEMKGATREHQEAIVLELIHSIKAQAVKNYKVQRGNNAEIVLDEAPRWIPQDTDGNNFAKPIIDAVNTTRAYGVSWTFATQRITAVSKSVLAQMHTKYYLRGLFVGADIENMRSDIGDEGVALYQSLQQDGGYFCVISGQELNFGAGASTVAMMGWDGDVNEQIKSHNPHVWSKRPWQSVMI